MLFKQYFGGKFQLQIYAFPIDLSLFYGTEVKDVKR